VFAQVGVWMAVYVVYLAAQGAAVGDTATAERHGRAIAGLEAALGLDVERAVQTALGGLQGALAAYYVAGYVPLLVAGLLWLGLVDRPSYRAARRALLAALLVAGVVYVLLPVAPPRLVPELGLADPVGLDPDGDVLLGLPYNPYAALPSLHVGHVILLAAAALRIARSPLLRAAWVAQPILMAIAVVATGNHYVLDVAAGAALGAVLLPVARGRRYPTRVPRTGRRGSSPSPAARVPSSARANSRKVRVSRDSGRLPERTQ
jgi:membrane-associated phospholipid phosphatase